MNHHGSTSVRERQDPLIALYKGAPEEDAITDRARTTGGADSDPVHRSS